MSTPQTRTLERIHTATVLRRQNYTTAQIARHLGVTTRTVARYASHPTPNGTPMTSGTITVWGDRAACKREDPELFFPVTYDSTSPQVLQAKAICLRCPVLGECMAFLVDNPQPAGVWAATTPSERRTARFPSYQRSTT